MQGLQAGYKINRHFLIFALCFCFLHTQCFFNILELSDFGKTFDFQLGKSPLFSIFFTLVYLSIFFPFLNPQKIFVYDLLINNNYYRVERKSIK